MQWKLYYDGGCNLCHGSKTRAEAWAERAGQALEAVPLQSPEALEKGYAGAEMVLEAERTYFAADAWLALLRIAPWYLRWVAWLGVVPGFRQLLQVGYRIVARYRHRWFGRRACPIPQPSDEGVRGLAEEPPAR
jgi:predicted DCC family thiol-disulfide oxidoreductase YuxK